MATIALRAPSFARSPEPLTVRPRQEGRWLRHIETFFLLFGFFIRKKSPEISPISLVSLVSPISLPPLILKE
ncbi:hypothetical protein [Dactylococcopsis salina]|uniref:hypothetical protein n=1 Tax=Dactylococcopsis salina TaxID=292566 RepID=UPI0002F6305E|nr:hypothetical protein [Dactylococcopsis salina]